MAQEWPRPPRTSSVLAYGRNGWWTTVMVYRVGESMLARDRQRDGQGKSNAPDTGISCKDINNEVDKTHTHLAN